MSTKLNDGFHNEINRYPILEARAAIALATEHAWNIAEPDGHWYGENLSNVSITAEHIFFLQSLGINSLPDRAAYVSFLLSQQQEDGSWSLAPCFPGDVSTSAEAYLALKILGICPDTSRMQKAKEFIRNSGGVEKVRIFTRVYFAQFGLWPWAAVPQLPAEFILMPSCFPLNIYKIASWARATVIPLLVIRHHEPVYRLPNGLSRENDFLDELWLEPNDKMVPYPAHAGTKDNGLVCLLFFTIDRTLYMGSDILKRLPSRRYALQRCIEWIVEHQEPQGDWFGIIQPMHSGIQALLLEGYTLEDDIVTRGLEALERFTWQDKLGKRLQCSVSPVWDTALMTRSLCDAGVSTHDPRLQRAIGWLKNRQLLGPEGDWRVHNRRLTPGGFSFQYYNTWYPDLDDTAAAILAIINHAHGPVECLVVSRAAVWLCGLQNDDGGWGAYDRNNNKLWVNQIPFSDMDAMCDPSSADITGRILEAFGLLLRSSDMIRIGSDILQRISRACDGALYYLANAQESTGAWFGRVGVNYVYGTSNVLCGLQYFSEGNEQVIDMMASATSWLKSVQNLDGGWGELLESYRDASLAGYGPSTPSQTAWGLMGLLTSNGPDDRAIVAAVLYLTRTQTDIQEAGASWPERRYTGTGFPNWVYFGYSLYRHYFPIMALGRYVKLSVAKSELWLD